ncbi:hypothetical protein P3S68_028861 [Capsicum galapagoense]
MSIVNFSVHLLTSRWYMAFSSLMILFMSGATFIFGLFSGEIKSSLGYDQTTLNLISFFKDLGGNLAIISGLIMEIVPPRAILAMGAMLNFFGYFMIWLVVTKRISKPHVWQMCLYICIGANSQSFANTGGTVTCVKNFPSSRGVVLGLLKGAVGLSGAIMTQLYLAFYGGDNKGGDSLILLVAWLPVLVTCIFLPSIRVMKDIHRDNDVKIFYNLLYVSLGLAIFLLIMIIVQKKFTFTRVEYVLSGVVVMVLIFSPLVLVIREELNIWMSKKGDISRLNMSIQVENPPSSKTNWSFCFKSAFKPLERGEDHTILQALFNVDMLILFVVATFGVGGTLTSIDNLGQIGKALDYPDSSISTFVSLVSIWNYLGRVSSGFASEILLDKYNFPRPLMLTFVLLLACIGHLLIAFGVRYSLYASSILMGFCFGAQWPLILSIISELFGLKYYATLYNFGSVASPIGGYILDVRVAGHLYDKEALKQLEAKGIFTRKIGDDLNCVGVQCYKQAFLIISGATFVGDIVSLILVLRTRKFYASDIYKKFKEESQVVNGTIVTSREID